MHYSIPHISLPKLFTFKNTLYSSLCLLASFVAFPGYSEWQSVPEASISQSERVYVRGSGYYSDVQISTPTHQTNPLRLLVTNASYTVTNADGLNDNEQPYFALTDLSQSLRIRFATQRGAFSYATELQQWVESNDIANPTVNGPVSFQNGSVHDPSLILTDDGTFYVFGSHLAAAKTTNLMDWTVFANEVNDANPLFSTYASEAAEGIAWSGGHIGSWAADVIQLADGKYYFYYNHCASPATGECDASRSYLGLAVADNVEGPYENLGLILRSGHVGSENPAINGQNYNGNTQPNAIDPDVFFDKEGRLWMVYGSYSGGIWIMEMDTASGFPLPNQGYGTKIMGGYYSAIEGPYMLYSPISDYYYLFTSFGGFAQNDGYNMRISRSRSPQGPFLDASGQNMIAAIGNWASIAPYGVKLMGGHQFLHKPGELGSDHGYMAPGHNSAYYDALSGRHFVIFHTRFPERGEGHEIRVHQLFINQDDWLVASPHRYVPIEGDNIVDSNDVLGTYQFINHGKDINRTAKLSSYLTLSSDGQVSGDYSGNYVLGDTNQITLNIDGQGSFDGVLAWQWNDNIQQLVPTFSALASSGESVWGTRIPPMTTEQIVAAISLAIKQPAVTTSDLTLETVGAMGASISWQSADTSVITTNGQVIRPLAGEPDKTVVLSAIINVNGESHNLSFSVTVKARKAYNRVALYQFENDLSDSLGYTSAGTVTGSSPVVEGGNVQYAAGEVGQAIWLDGTSGVRLPDGLIANNTYTVSMWLNPVALTQFSSVFFGAQAADNWLSLVPWGWDNNTMLWRGSLAWYDATAGIRIAENSWSHVAFTVNQGEIKLYINGNLTFSGSNFSDIFTDNTALFSLGVNYWDFPFNGLIDELAIYDDALTQAEILALDYQHLDNSALLAQVTNNINLGNLNAVSSNILLPLSGNFDAQINWSSSDPSIINAQGKITPPAYGNSEVVTLTATVILNGEQLTRDFLVTVVAEQPDGLIASFSFDNSDLSDDTGAFAVGQVTGAQIGQTGGQVSFNTGIKGQALVLNGQSGVLLPNNLLTDNSYSVSLWLNPDALTMFTPAFFAYSSTDSWVSLVPRGHDFVAQQSMIWSGTAWYDAGIGSTIPTNSWSHLVFTVDEGTLSIYLNGSLVFSNSGFPDVLSSAGAKGFALGVNFWDTAFSGQIDEVGIYDQAISASVVGQLFELGNP